MYIGSTCTFRLVTYCCTHKHTLVPLAPSGVGNTICMQEEVVTIHVELSENERAVYMYSIIYHISSLWLLVQYGIQDLRLQCTAPASSGVWSSILHRTQLASSLKSQYPKHNLTAKFYTSKTLSL